MRIILPAFLALLLFSTIALADSPLDGWRFYSPEADVAIADVWQVGDDGVLVCQGEPLGYIETVEPYEDVIVELEYRWPKEPGPGKCGVLIRKSGEDRIWPTSLEAQINHPDAGDFWGLAGYSLDGPAARKTELDHPEFGHLTNLKRTMDAEKPVGQWNRYRIVAEGEVVTLYINGKQVNRATGCDVVAGPVLLTAEGSEIHFRNINIQKP